MSEPNQKTKELNRMRIEFAFKQKKGLPFILASAVLWTVMLIAFLTDLDLTVKNIIAMGCSALLMPCGMLFGKLIKVNIFSKENPLSGLSVVAALNQLLYLPIVLWVMYTVPEKMIMAYAIAVGAHFLPYYWIYFSPTYFYASIVIPVVSLILGINFGQFVVCLAFVGFDILICLLLCLENRQAKELYSSITEKDGSTGQQAH
ncbi:MAG: hypothetical protein J6Z46_06165 [Lachnospiraceae bacterium]|nr:hypothetical protein [Lachnospiraceae bacterium]